MHQQIKGGDIIILAFANLTAILNNKKISKIEIKGNYLNMENTTFPRLTSRLTLLWQMAKYWNHSHQIYKSGCLLSSLLPEMV